MKTELIELQSPEKKRIYVYPNGDSIELHNVIKIGISQSGNHRLETVDGKKHIAAAGWLHIEIDSDNWTF